jgi:hypothetical protein
VHRCPDHTHALRLKHRIEATRELAVPVANQKTNRLLPFTESPRDLPCLLGDPPPRRDGPCSRPDGRDGCRVQ